MSFTENMLMLAGLIALNGFFALAEISIAASRPLKLKQLIEAGNAKAAIVLSLAREPTDFITVVQIGLNIVIIFSGIFGEGAIAPLLRQALLDSGASVRLADVLSVAGAVLIVALLFIVFGDVLPKKIGLALKEDVACKVAAPIRSLTVAIRPLIRFIGYVTDRLLALVRVDPRDERLTTADIKALVDEGVETGALVSHEHSLINNVLSLEHRTVASAMTLRNDIVHVDLNETEEQIKRKISQWPHARFVVCDGEIDNVLGYIESTRLLSKYLNNEHLLFNRDRLSEQGLRPILVVPSTLSLLTMLERFNESREDIAIVVSEYGLVVGMVTLNDVMSSLMNDVIKPLPGNELIIQRAANSWLIDGSAPISDVKKLLGFDALPGEENYETIGGFLMYLMKRMPKKADSIVYGDVRFEIVDTEKYKIDEVMATRQADAG